MIQGRVFADALLYCERAYIVDGFGAQYIRTAKGIVLLHLQNNLADTKKAQLFFLEEGGFVSSAGYYPDDDL